MEQLIKGNSRIEVVDALRGFAVMAIVLVHNLEHFIFPVYPVNSPEWLNVLDEGVLNGVFSLFAGKAYAIFALLFGFTFYIQTNNQKKQGKDFGYRFLWRMLLLLVFATLNAAFFPAGDVLLLFAVVSLVLFLTRNWSDKAVLITSIIFLLQPVEWYHYIASLFNPAHQLPDLKVGEMYAEVAEYTKAGNFGDFLLGNMAFFFVPAAVGLIEKYAELTSILIPFIVISAVSTLAVMTVTGKTLGENLEDLKSVISCAEKAEKIRKTTEEIPLKFDSITTSIGYVFSENPEKQSYERWLSYADKAVYQAKKNGRNCVVEYEKEK